MSEEIESADVELDVVEKSPEDAKAESRVELSKMFKEMNEAMPDSWRDQSVEYAENLRNEQAEEAKVVDVEDEVVDVEDEVEVEEAEVPDALIFKSGEETFEVPEGATIEIKIDGELVEVPISDIKNGLSGQKAIAQKFSALDAERKAVESERAYFEQGRQAVQQLASDNKPLEAFDYILTEAGLNTETFVSSFFEQIAVPLNDYMTMAPEQQVLWAEQLKSERNRLQYEQVSTENERLLAEREQVTSVKRVQTQHGLDDAQFADLYHRISGEIQAGTIPSQPVTAEIVGQYHVLLNRESWIRDSLEAVSPRFASDDAIVGSILSKVNGLAREGKEISEKEVLELVTETYGMPSKVDKAKKVRASLDKKGNSSALSAGVTSVPGDKSYKEEGATSKHFLQTLNEGFSSATSAEERQKIIQQKRSQIKKR